MLGKLIRHEWKATYKIAGSMLLFLVVLGLLTGLSFWTPSWRSIVSDNAAAGVTLTDVLVITLLILYFISIFVVSVGMVIYLAVHFFKGMYTEEGYLTHTLPATAHELLGSRIIVGSGWMILYGLAVVVSGGIVVAILMQVVLHASGMPTAEFWSLLADRLVEANGVFREGSGMSLVTCGLIYALMLAVGCVTSVCYLYGAATLGQLSAKHKVLMSIASYFGIMIVNQIITSVVILPMSWGNMVVQSVEDEIVISPASYILGTSLAALGLNVLIATALYFISVYIIKNKLNLE